MLSLLADPEGEVRPPQSVQAKRIALLSHDLTERLRSLATTDAP